MFGEKMLKIIYKNYYYKNLTGNFMSITGSDALEVVVEDKLLFRAYIEKGGDIEFSVDDEEPVTFKCQDDYYIKVKRFVRDNDGKISNKEMIKYFIRVGDELSKMAGKPLPEKLMAELLLNYLGWLKLLSAEKTF